MNLLVNFNDYLHSHSASWESLHNESCSDGIYCVLDTRTLCIDKIKEADLRKMLDMGVIGIDNMCFVSGEIRVREGMQDFLSMGRNFKNIEYDVSYIIDPDSVTVAGKIYPCGHLEFGNIPLKLICVYQDELWKLYISGKEILEFKGNENGVGGIAYLFRILDCIYVQYMFMERSIHCLTLAFTMSGKLIDVFSSDSFFGDIQYATSECRDRYFRKSGRRF